MLDHLGSSFRVWHLVSLYMWNVALCFVLYVEAVTDALHS
jgi:hypothetical protein